MPTPSRKTILLATDQQRSVLNALDANRPHPIAYTPYGHRPLENGLLSLLGFNGERPDPVTGHYHLGNGYRQFNPVLMRFNSPDSWSPFGEGGLNAYAYCNGDPRNCEDKNGHTGTFFAIFKIPRPNFIYKKSTSTLFAETATLKRPDTKIIGTSTQMDIKGSAQKNNSSISSPELQKTVRPEHNSSRKTKLKHEIKELANTKIPHIENQISYWEKNIIKRDSIWKNSSTSHTRNELIEFRNTAKFTLNQINTGIANLNTSSTKALTTLRDDLSNIREF
jgi:RHS repeat-associated protein